MRPFNAIDVVTSSWLKEHL